jgi:hypothetical protein
MHARVVITVSSCLVAGAVCAAQERSAADDVARLRERLAIQQQRVEEQQQTLDDLKAQLKEAESAALMAASAPSTQAGAAQRPMNPTQEIARERPEGPSIEVGPARLRIGGYLGLTGLFRSTNAGGSVGTSFGSIPYGDTVQGNVSEARLSAQSSRISIRVDADFPEPRPRFRQLSGYFEMDFNGTTPGTVAVTSSSVGFRLRHAFAEVRYGGTFLLSAGQAFSLMTPAKRQISMWPSDVEISQAVDTNYLAGLIWDRAPQFRLTWRPSTRFNWAVSLENPEQQLGRGVVTLPACCAADLDAQYNTGSDELKVPNLIPDTATRVAFNPTESFHIDVGGVLRVFRHTIHPYDNDFKEVGGGATLNGRLNVSSSTTLLGQGAFGSGLGRYVGGLAPDVAFRRDGSITPIPTTSWVVGLEQRASSRVSLAGYYSGLTTGDRFDAEAEGGYVGFGYPGSSNSNNRRIHQLTGTGSYQIVRSDDRGSAQLTVQVSWLEREPWSRGAGPDAASALMVFAQVRYNLP